MLARPAAHLIGALRGAQHCPAASQSARPWGRRTGPRQAPPMPPRRSRVQPHGHQQVEPSIACEAHARSGAPGTSAASAWLTRVIRELSGRMTVRAPLAGHAPPPAAPAPPALHSTHAPRVRPAAPRREAGVAGGSRRPPPTGSSRNAGSVQSTRRSSGTPSCRAESA